ncbi:MAG: SDR family oxidoreductase [Acidimicrobiia bacterium]|nr:SDR family oxidoreductase [Acidimicrobiia bacterium]MDH4307756.1 SDR family oxidoreductase [Acidimicrobiia bacterium]MDH5521917.1 SDR family oxidoreductase [Acidimicrobiia bacterium]
MNVVVFGASGYVGGRLIPVLLAAGHAVRAITRSPTSLRDYPWRDDVEVMQADLLDPATILPALDGMDAAYYLVHSMGTGDFQDLDRRAAANMAAAAEQAGIERMIYLGALGRGDLSPHLASRQEVGEILATGPVPVTEFRAAVIIGSGSLSFEMTRYLTEVLPVMMTPSWVRTRCQPIAIRDVLSYLEGALVHSETKGRIIEIGGPEVLTYEEMMQGYAGAAGLRRRLIIRVPVLSLGLSARWVGLVTPLPSSVAEHLVESLRHEVVVTDTSADELIPVQRIGYREAVSQAIEQTRGADVPTRWTRSSWQPADPLPSDPSHAFGTIFSDRREVEVEADPADVAWAFMRVGGANGYYAARWAWHIRGIIDQLFGGAGLRRGRRHPEEIRVGEPLDFWRVVRVEPGTSLELKAEMLLPGEAWLGWTVERTGTGSRLVQTAWFVPRGLFGRIYWYAMLPFHALVFPQMARGIAAAAEERARIRANASSST